MPRALALIVTLCALCLSSRALAQTTITFDSPSAPGTFSEQMQPISAYDGALVFSNTTMEVLNESGAFGVTGHSAPNFLAWNDSITNQSFTLTFPAPSSAISLRVGSVFNGTATIQSFNGAGTMLSTQSVGISTNLVTINVPASGVASLTFSVTGAYGVVDDITFTTAACGNGVIDASEQCDDGNAVAGDCCSPTCTFEPASTVCRAVAGVCDLAETCTGASGTCPADSFLSAATVCRASVGDCDLAESCTGAGAACPADASAPDGSACGALMTCDGPSSCQAGACVAMPVDCDDNNACTNDSCSDPGAMCVHMTIEGCCNTGADCDDGDPCTQDSCLVAVCSNTPIAGCGEGGGGAGAGGIGGGGVGGQGGFGGGSGGDGVGGDPVSGGAGSGGDTAADDLDDGGCDCRSASTRGSASGAWIALALAAIAARRRRRAA